MIGRYVAGETAYIMIDTHKFETGVEFVASVSGYYIKVGAGLGTKVALTFAVWDGLTGVYKAEIDTTGFAEGMYFAQVTADIDSKIVHTTKFFEIRNVYARYAP